MAKKQTASQTRKSHKSRKTEPDMAAVQATVASLALGRATPPSPDPATAPPSVPDVPVEDPKQQMWYRPADSKARKAVDKIVVMREAGHEDKEIAKRLKTTEGTVRNYMYLARKNGWLDADDEPVDLELELALNVDRKVVRNINASLDGQMTNWQTHEMTIAAAKGRGMFKAHEVSKNEQAVTMPVVAIQVIMPPLGVRDQLQEIPEEQMGGVPAYIEGEAVE